MRRLSFGFVALVGLLLLLVVSVVGCGEENSMSAQRDSAESAAMAEVELHGGLGDMSGGQDAPAATPAPTAAPTPAAALPPVAASDQSSNAGSGSGRVQTAPLPQSRIIVHTARISLVVDDVAGTVDRIVGVAQGLGGWMVSSDRTSEHTGSVAIRVPAESLDEAFRQVEALALEVESRAVTSEDVTDEYVDSQSRLASMRATEVRLLSFLEQARNVEDALLVQKEIGELQRQIEQVQGRLNFLSQTAAYSLIEVYLKPTSEAVDVDAGEDMSVRVGQVARFRASFRAPSDIDEFSFTWDFGDGTSTSGSGSVLRPEGHRVTATVNHTYEDDRDSPYIVAVELRGTGEGGVAEGSDSIEVAVREVPTIEVFAGENLTAEQGEDIDYSASFTRPSELRDYEYQWDFGDGSPTVVGSLSEGGEGSTRVETSHAFRDHRPAAYTVTLKVTAMSDAGEVSGTDEFLVHVTESEGLLVWGWDVGETAWLAVRVLTGTAWVVVTVVIWAGILSPVIIGLLGIVFLVRRVGRRLNFGGGGGAGRRSGRRSAWVEEAVPEGEPPVEG